ncbi:MAG: glycosyltransferase, partial [Nitrosopumilaceae archaeon]
MVFFQVFLHEIKLQDVVEALLELDWPKDKLEIIVVDDKSTDDSVKVIQEYVNKYSNVRL